MKALTFWKKAIKNEGIFNDNKGKKASICIVFKKLYRNENPKPIELYINTVPIIVDPPKYVIAEDNDEAFLTFSSIIIFIQEKCNLPL